ncbi:hypothetical protein BZA77DRAFT_317446 [Pyronema omphalodes]|nr:hypothetical protein BZA77DRAFT_317446 [Pyronema omphalodes]
MRYRWEMSRRLEVWVIFFTLNLGDLMRISIRNLRDRLNICNHDVACSGTSLSLNGLRKCYRSSSLNFQRSPYDVPGRQ